MLLVLLGLIFGIINGQNTPTCPIGTCSRGDQTTTDAECTEIVNFLSQGSAVPNFAEVAICNDDGCCTASCKSFDFCAQADPGSTCDDTKTVNECTIPQQKDTTSGPDTTEESYTTATKESYTTATKESYTTATKESYTTATKESYTTATKESYTTATKESYTTATKESYISTTEEPEATEGTGSGEGTGTTEEEETCDNTLCHTAYSANLCYDPADSDEVLDGFCSVRFTFDVDVCFLIPEMTDLLLRQDIEFAFAAVLENSDDGDSSILCADAEFIVGGYICTTTNDADFDVSKDERRDGFCDWTEAQCDKKNFGNGKKGAANFVGWVGAYCECDDVNDLIDHATALATDVVQTGKEWAEKFMKLTAQDDTHCASGFGMIEVNDFDIIIKDSDGNEISLAMGGGVTRVYGYLGSVFVLIVVSLL